MQFPSLPLGLVIPHLPPWQTRIVQAGISGMAAAWDPATKPIIRIVKTAPTRYVLQFMIAVPVVHLSAAQVLLLAIAALFHLLNTARAATNYFSPVQVRAHQSIQDINGILVMEQQTLLQAIVYITPIPQVQRQLLYIFLYMTPLPDVLHIPARPSPFAMQNLILGIR